jgi:VWFA-related protein
MRRAIAIFLFAAVTARAQTIGQNAPPGGTPGNSSVVTFTTGTQLVVEAIVVTDKKGSPVEGLTAKDFTVAEDGVAQAIRFFDHQNLPQTSGAAPAESQPEHIHIYDKLGRTQISREEPGNARYKDRRLLALYFDMMAMPPGDQLRALAAAEKFIRTQMTPADLLAILRYSGGAVDVLQDFTGDHDRLLSIIQTMLVGEGQGMDYSTDDASSPDTGAAFGQDDSEFNIFNTDRQLSALQTAANMLGQLNERKSLIYFASGLRLNGLNNQAQLHATINAAIRAGVSFWWGRTGRFPRQVCSKTRRAISTALLCSVAHRTPEQCSSWIRPARRRRCKASQGERMEGFDIRGTVACCWRQSHSAK